MIGVILLLKEKANSRMKLSPILERDVGRNYASGRQKFVLQLQQNRHFEVSFIKRFAFCPENEEGIPKHIFHKHSVDIFKWR